VKTDRRSVFRMQPGNQLHTPTALIDLRIINPGRGVTVVDDISALRRLRVALKVIRRSSISIRRNRLVPTFVDASKQCKINTLQLSAFDRFQFPVQASSHKRDIARFASLVSTPHSTLLPRRQLAATCSSSTWLQFRCREAASWTAESE